MNPVRVPVVAGVAQGVGTTTLASALHGQDRGRYPAEPLDVLVCRVGSLDAAAAVAGAPVLAVVADAPTAAAEPALLQQLRSQFGAVVLLPHVARLQEAENPLSVATGLLGLPPGLRPAALKPYAEGLLAIVDALLRGGSLIRSTPVEHPVRRGAGLVRRPPVRLQAAAPAPRPIPVSPPLPVRLVARRAAVRVTPITPASGPVRRAGRPHRSDAGFALDDEALEAEPYLRPHRRTG